MISVSLSVYTARHTQTPRSDRSRVGPQEGPYTDTVLDLKKATTEGTLVMQLSIATNYPDA